MQGGPAIRAVCQSVLCALLVTRSVQGGLRLYSLWREMCRSLAARICGVSDVWGVSGLFSVAAVRCARRASSARGGLPPFFVSVLSERCARHTRLAKIG